jgi:hypothetical protein
MTDNLDELIKVCERTLSDDEDVPAWATWCETFNPQRVLALLKELKEANKQVEHLLTVHCCNCDFISEDQPHE